MRISLLLPYWDRQAAADKALALLAKQYADIDLEVIVVDDGNAVPFQIPTLYDDEMGPVRDPSRWRSNWRVITLPRKNEPKSPCVPWNEAAKVATGDILILSCIEVLHEQPILEPLVQAVIDGGPDAYVLAAAWCPEAGEWHCHSTVEVPTCPEGSGIGFCSALRKSLYIKAGGFSEEYREGAGYEDRDFIWRLTKAGAKFIKRDDLVVTHPKAGASIAWGFQKFQRNEGIYLAKWTGFVPTRRVTFCCVQAGNYCGRGAEYVNVLYDMVARTVPPGLLFRFVCLTDDPAGLHKDIETIALPKDIKGWYGKLYMFKRGLFADGERLIYFDLDTLILGKLDDLVAYEGEFATLTDFYFPERVGPAVMLWKAGGTAARIWEAWEEEGRPENQLGDLWWINQLGEGAFVERADRLQKLFPGQIASFKRDCAPLPPKGTRIVCFHGLPRPHEAAETDEWVAMCWKVGGSVHVDWDVVGNSSYEQTAKNIAASSKLPIPWLPIVPAHERPAAIVGGGPSLLQMLPELRARAAQGLRIFAVNGAHGFLLAHGIEADAQVIIDARPENARFVTGQANAYFLASQCDPAVFEAAKGAPITLVHMNTRGVLDSIPESLQPLNLVSSGCTVALAAIAIAYCLGHRQLSVYGLDSSYEEAHHAYPQASNDQDRVVEAIAGGRKFKCAPWMIAQVEHFQKLAAELAQDGCEISVRCGGLLGHVAWLWTMQEEAA